MKKTLIFSTILASHLFAVDYTNNNFPTQIVVTQNQQDNAELDCSFNHSCVFNFSGNASKTITFTISDGVDYTLSRKDPVTGVPTNFKDRTPIYFENFVQNGGNFTLEGFGGYIIQSNFNLSGVGGKATLTIKGDKTNSTQGSNLSISKNLILNQGTINTENIHNFLVQGTSTFSNNSRLYAPTTVTFKSDITLDNTSSIEVSKLELAGIKSNLANIWGDTLTLTNNGGSIKIHDNFENGAKINSQTADEHCVTSGTCGNGRVINNAGTIEVGGQLYKSF